jgi:hypothetical protein
VLMLPFVRTYNEAILYIRLRPCGCGETEATWLDVRLTLDDAPARYFTAECPGCGRPREFTLAMPAEAKQLPDLVFGEGDEVSRVIDPGEWLGVADLYGRRAEELLSNEELSDDDVNAIYYALSARVSAFDEILKFLPPKADIMPEWLCRSTTGRAIYEQQTARFVRGTLFAERAALWANLERFVQDFTGDDDETTTGSTPHDG